MGAAISRRLPVESIDENCYIIVVVGQTGVGKSTFINTAAGDDILAVGHGLKHDTRQVNYVECYDPERYDERKVVFVDTPGFDSEKEESVIEKKLKSWLKKVSSKKLKIFGILYLHRITDPKLSGLPIRHTALLRTLCEESIKGFPNRVILVTTMWGTGNSAQQRVYEKREEELQKYWDGLPSGSVVSEIMRFDKTAESAWKIVFALRCMEDGTDNRPGSEGPSSLILQIIKNPSKRGRVTELSGDNAQCIADFLSQLLHQDGALSSDDKKHLLSLLQQLVKSAQVLPQCYKLQEVQCDFSQAREGGSFADVYQGQYGKQKVCIKAIRIFRNGDNARILKAFAKEIVLWANLLHENILPFYGIYQGPYGRICIISPWVDPGDLSVYLQSFPQRPRPPLVLDITAGLRYLHQSDIVHGDLKANNILVSDDGRALIADFGISSIVLPTKLASTQLSSGTMRWMAPELFTGEEESRPTMTLKSDIWSLGCVYYEIFTRKLPFYHCASDTRLLSVRSIPKAIPHRPTDESEVDIISDDMWKLMEKCWDNEPCSRPNCHDIHALVTDLLGVGDRRCSHDVPLWKAVKGRSRVGAIRERARCILFQILDSQTGLDSEHAGRSSESIRGS
ncbi:hypothetical protein Agabi119p4_6063 [Agaricus bisporus var. burnettii]|uniref:Protein kinase domain-containing protein n=1 Tax=Agaricus bisporus var. burnettii TaxID=192524 RepID=A0A8H7KGA5_AGABI|nr:hypothetical protein Agabi119p4_6063 [Agaricus bisporus var. burnettii]